MTPAKESVQETPGASAAVPYESVPELAANEHFISLMERARSNKRDLERIEKEQDAIRLEAGHLAAVAGVKSVSFFDLVLTNADGGVTKGKLTGAGLIEQLENTTGLDAYAKARAERAIQLAAKECDPQALVLHGFPAHLIEPARDPGKPRAGSTQLSWAGAKGKGAKDRAAGSGSSIQ